MSLKRNCDVCGKVIDDVEKQFSDIAIFFGDSEEPSYEFEDVCPRCKEEFIKMIGGYIKRAGMPQSIISTPQPRTEIKLPAALEVVPRYDTTPIATESNDVPIQDGPQILANAVVKTIPMKPLVRHSGGNEQ